MGVIFIFRWTIILEWRWCCSSEINAQYFVFCFSTFSPPSDYHHIPSNTTVAKPSPFCNALLPFPQPWTSLEHVYHAVHGFPWCSFLNHQRVIQTSLLMVVEYGGSVWDHCKNTMFCHAAQFFIFQMFDVVSVIEHEVMSSWEDSFPRSVFLSRNLWPHLTWPQHHK